MVAIQWSYRHMTSRKADYLFMLLLAFAISPLLVFMVWAWANGWMSERDPITHCPLASASCVAAHPSPR